MKNAMVVMGYNNTRINDVKKIREKAWDCLGAITILCKKDPTESDKHAADFVIDVDLTQSTKNIETIVQRCQAENIKIIGVLPFSDAGTQLGAGLAAHLHLPGADPHRITAALNKKDFREKEAKTNKPKHYKAVTACAITHLKALQETFITLGSAIFVKPMAEGNSRGCMAIKRFEDCTAAWDELAPYVAGGITAEALIEHAQEYSVEHVAGYAWITEKKTTQTQYRAEPRHIVPAPLHDNEASILQQGARFMAELCGYGGCAYHNEIFLLDTKDSVMAVEPNLRPAGARIWDLGSHAFEDFDPWTAWITWAAGKVDAAPKPLKQNAFCGLHFISAKKSGTLQAITIADLKQLSQHMSGDFVELVWTKHIGDRVTSLVKDNADFIGYVMAKSPDYNNLCTLLTAAEKLLSHSCHVDA